MRPNPQNPPQTYDIFRSQLTQIININHELVQLSQAIDWKYLEERNAEFYKEEGRPGVRARLIIGLHLLKYMFNLSDENVCERWVYDPYFQFFCSFHLFSMSIAACFDQSPFCHPNITLP